MLKYIGATIGPIVDTISRARKTRSAWRASYIYSYIMKKIIIELKNDNRVELILPFSKEEKVKVFEENSHLGAGLFHDRLIIEVSDNEFKLESLSDIKDRVFNDIAEKINSEKKLEVKKYFDTYMNFYTIEKELEGNENIIFEISKYLDVMELQPQMCLMQFENGKNYLFDFIKDKDNKLLEEDAYGIEHEDKIKSLPEIAWTDIYNQIDDKSKINENPDNSDDEDGFNYFRREHKALFKKHHKYYSIVRADGDGIGAIINEFKEKSEYQDFSNILFEFAKDSVKEIEEYGGLPIFAGGDDLLFFAPIINSSCAEYKNIFELTTALSNIFEKKVKEITEDRKATLSFGITMNYYKYPLYEAYGDSATELFGKAKNYNGKDATAVRLLKGSSKPIEFILNKGEKQSFQSFLNSFLLEAKDKNMIKGVVYTLENQIKILECIQADEEKLNNFFKNNFKKEVHTEKDGENTVLNPKMKAILKECIAYGKKDRIETVLKLLRFVMFLTEEGNANE